MDREDGFRNAPPTDCCTSSADDEDSPVRKKFKTYSISENSMQEDNETCSEPNTQETVLTGVCGETAEVSETAAKTDDQQDHHNIVSHATDDNNNNSLATGENTSELQTNRNDTVVNDDRNIDSAMDLESTVQPETRYIIPQNLLYRPSITKKHNSTPDSFTKSDKQHAMPKMTSDMSANLEQIRQDFIRSWDRILAADDLIPETEMQTLNSSTPAKICEYLNELARTNATNENLRQLVPKVCDEIKNLQQGDGRIDEIQTFEPEPVPIPIGDFLTDPLESLESDHPNSMVGEQYEFDTDHWYRIQQAFTIPEQLPEFNELFTNEGVLVPNRTEDGARDNNVGYEPMADIPNELAHIYNTIIREASGNQPGQSTTKRQTEDPYMSNVVNADSQPIHRNHDADLYRSLLGITPPFEQNVNTQNEESTTSIFNTNPVCTLNRPLETERVPSQIFSNTSAIAESDFNNPELDSAPVNFETNPAQMDTTSSNTLTNPSESVSNASDIGSYFFEVTPAELESNTAEVVTNPCPMETNPAASDPNPAPSNASSVDLTSTSVLSESNSTQEDSDASSPSGFDAYESGAEFVVVPSRNNFKPLTLTVDPNAATNEHTAHHEPTDENTSDSTPNVTSDEEEPNDADPSNSSGVEEMNPFETEMSTIETDISRIMEEAERFDQQAGRFEESAVEYPEVQVFFRRISEIYEFAAMSLQEAIDNFETTPLVDVDDNSILDEVDPISEGMDIEDDNVPDQQVPDIDHSC